MNIIQIKRRIDSIMVFMEPYWEFVNSHMVSYLTDDHWTKYVPKDIKDEIKNGDQVKECIEHVFWNKKKNTSFPAIEEFVAKAQLYTCSQFDDVITTVQQLETILLPDESQQDETSNLSIKEFLTAKKQHEVETTASLVHKLVMNYSKKLSDKEKEQLFIIDAGDGKGYLSSRLALQYNYKVLGLDANQNNSKNALKRNCKLQRAWPALTEKAAGKPADSGKKEPESASHEETDSNKAVAITRSNYRTATAFITEFVQLLPLLCKHFDNVEQPIVCLTGLHTCGELAPICLKIFHAQSNCKILCNIGCCYHLLVEAFEKNPGMSLLQQTFPSFPKSVYLMERRLKLGRNARMLAAQSIERTMLARELPNISLYYRALLEVILKSPNFDLQKTAEVGKIRKFSSFEEYFELCMTKLKMDKNKVTAAYLAKVQKKYGEKRDFLNLFYLLRQCLAPVVESLILLDRLLYLKEFKHEQSYLVPIFDEVTSPRHFAIIALKSN